MSKKILRTVIFVVLFAALMMLFACADGENLNEQQNGGNGNGDEILGGVTGDAPTYKPGGNGAVIFPGNGNGNIYYDPIIPGGSTPEDTKPEDTKPEDGTSEHVHNFQFFQIEEPTCTMGGRTEYRCDGCDALDYRDFIKEKGHSFGDYYTVIEAGVFNAGLKRRVCSVCEFEEDKETAAVSATLTYSLENGKKTLTVTHSAPANFESILLSTGFDATAFDNVSIVGTPIPFSELEKLVFGKNVTKIISCGYDSPALKEVVFSSDVSYIGEKAFWCSINLERLCFEGDAPEIDESAFLINGQPSVYVVPKQGALGFDGISFGGADILREWLEYDAESVFALTLSKYAVKAADSAEKLALDILKLYKDKGHLEFAFIPYTADMSEYRIIKDFTLELTKNCSTEKEKIDTVYNWIISNVVYDDNALKYEPYDVFTKKKAVCAGYVTLMYDMLSALDIVSFYTRGSTLFGNTLQVRDIFQNAEDISSHAWLTIILSDGTVTYYDPTWGVSNAEAYRDMTKAELASHAVTFELDGLEVIIAGASYKMYEHTYCTVEFLYEDGYIYASYGGKLSQAQESATYFNYWFSESYALRNDNLYQLTANQPMGSAYNSGLLSPNHISGQAIFCRADGRSFMLSRIGEFVTLQNTVYGKNISFLNGYFIEKNGLVFNTVNGELAVVGYYGTSSELTIPAEVNGLKVKVIALSAFYNNKTVKRLIIENGVEEIWISAFYNCANLEYIYIPASVKYNTDSEQNIGTSSIAFDRCMKLSWIQVSPDNPYFASLDGNLYSKDMKELIVFTPNSEIKDFVLPLSVEKIASNAFRYTKLRSVEFSSSLKSIGYSAFWYSAIESVRIPGGVSLGEWAFAYCYNLQQVVIEDGIKEIPTAAFMNCNTLISISIPSSVEVIGENAFAVCTRLYKIKLPEGVKTIKKGAFVDTPLVSITLPSTLISIESGAFEACYRLFIINNLSSLELVRGSDGHGGIAARAKEINKTVCNDNMYVTDSGLVFYNNGEDNILVEYIAMGATELILPETFMGKAYVLVENTFADFSYSGWETYYTFGIDNWSIEVNHSGKEVTKVVIPKSITYIPKYAFAGWDNIEYVFYEGTSDEWEMVDIETERGSNVEILNATIVFKTEDTNPDDEKPEENEPEHVHDFKFVETVNPTCANGGYSIYFCDGCQTEEKRDHVASLSHTMGEYEVVKEPTFYEEGVNMRTCKECKLYTESENIPKVIVTLTYTKEGGLDVVTVTHSYPMALNSHLLGYYHTITAENLKIVGDPVAFSEVEKLVLGANVSEISDYGCSISADSLEIVVISEDVSYIGLKAFWNSINLKKIYFEGDAPEIDDRAFLINCQPQVYAIPKKDALGFEGVTFGGIDILREWIEISEEEIFALTLSEYSVKAADAAEKLALDILKLYKDKGHLEFALIPYTEDMEQYRIIKDFTLELTASCTTEKEKIDVIYDWIVSNVRYDDGALRYEPYDVFTKKKAVCAGYVTLMHDMLAAVDVVSLYTRGSTLSGNEAKVEDIFKKPDNLPSHAWLTIPLSDGTLTYYDPTWGVSNPEYYRDMTKAELAAHALALEVDGLEVIIDGARYSMYTHKDYMVEFLYEDGYVYVSLGGQIHQGNYSSTYFNYWFGEGYFLKRDDTYQILVKQPTSSVYNTGLLASSFNGGDAVFCRADGRVFMLSRICEFVSLQNSVYGKNISLTNELFVEKDGVLFYKADGALAVVGYFGTNPEVTIPASVDGLAVKTIARRAFSNSKNVRRLIIEDGIEEIWDLAFDNCENLEYIYIPASVKYNTSNEQTLSRSSIAFDRCMRLAYIEVSPDSPYLASLDGNLYSKDMKELIVFSPNSAIKDFVFPASVEKIAGYAFRYTKLRSVEFSSSLKSIGYSAFWYSAIESVRIPGGVSLGEWAFAYCYNLREVVIEEGIKTIPTAAFIHCNTLINVSIPSSVEVIGADAFAVCTRLYILTLPEGVTTIGRGAFTDCPLVSITLPSTLTLIAPGAFVACDRLFIINNLSSLELSCGSYDHGEVARYAREINTTVDNGNLYVGEDGLVFYNDGEVNLLVEYISMGAEILILPEKFMGKEYSIVDKVFADFAYEGWEVRDGFDMDSWYIEVNHSGKEVTKVVIPKSIKNIPIYAFAGWDNIEYVLYEGTASEWIYVNVDTGNGDSNVEILNAAVVFYSENEPTESGLFWHYVDGEPEFWK